MRAVDRNRDVPTSPFSSPLARTPNVRSTASAERAAGIPRKNAPARVGYTPRLTPRPRSERRPRRGGPSRHGGGGSFGRGGSLGFRAVVSRGGVPLLVFRRSGFPGPALARGDLRRGRPGGRGVSRQPADVRRKLLRSRADLRLGRRRRVDLHAGGPDLLWLGGVPGGDELQPGAQQPGLLRPVQSSLLFPGADPLRRHLLPSGDDLQRRHLRTGRRLAVQQRALHLRVRFDPDVHRRLLLPGAAELRLDLLPEWSGLQGRRLLPAHPGLRLVLLRGGADVQQRRLLLRRPDRLRQRHLLPGRLGLRPGERDGQFRLLPAGVGDGQRRLLLRGLPLPAAGRQLRGEGAGRLPGAGIARLPVEHRGDLRRRCCTTCGITNGACQGLCVALLTVDPEGYAECTSQCTTTNLACRGACLTRGKVCP